MIAPDMFEKLPANVTGPLKYDYDFRFMALNVGFVVVVSSYLASLMYAPTARCLLILSLSVLVLQRVRRLMYVPHPT